ncbi:MAG: GIY-YIG nuclease family protein [Pseudomonadota bacterium]
MTRSTDPRWSVYVVRCRDGSLYTGITVDVAQRLATHESGLGSKYLRGRGPLSLVQQTVVGDRADASRVEYAFKQLTKAAKENVLAAPSGLRNFVSGLLV